MQKNTAQERSMRGEGRPRGLTSARADRGLQLRAHPPPHAPTPRPRLLPLSHNPRLTWLQQMTSSLPGSSTRAQSLARKPGTAAAAAAAAAVSFIIAPLPGAGRGRGRRRPTPPCVRRGLRREAPSLAERGWPRPRAWRFVVASGGRGLSDVTEALSLPRLRAPRS